jgi:hypothetical protein
MRGLCAVLLLVLLCPLAVQADVDCDGVDDVLTTGLALSTFVTPGAYTVTAWVKLLGAAVTSSACWDGSALLTDAAGYLVLGRFDATTFCGYTYDGTSKWVSTPSAAGWTHLAVSLGGGTLSLYKNGALASTLGGVGSISVLTGAVQLCKGTEGAPLADRVTDVQVYASALSAGELASLGQSRRRLTTRTPPTARWPLDGCPDGAAGQGVTFADRSGNQRPLTGAAGANTTGLTCRASEWLSRPMPIQ